MEQMLVYALAETFYSFLQNELVRMDPVHNARCYGSLHSDWH